MKILIFLQNAWSPLYAGREWPRESWLRALKRSRSGQRLRLLFESPLFRVYPDPFQVCYNTTLEVVEKPNQTAPPDVSYMWGVLDRCEPDIVIGCGKQAEKALLDMWPGYLLCLPHPAWRTLQDMVYAEAVTMLGAGFADRCVISSPEKDVVQKKYYPIDWEAYTKFALKREGVTIDEVRS